MRIIYVILKVKDNAASHVNIYYINNKINYFKIL